MSRPARIWAIGVVALLLGACGGAGSSSPAASPVASPPGVPPIASAIAPSPSPGGDASAPTARGYHRVIDVDGPQGVLLLSGQRLPGPVGLETVAPDAVWSFTVEGGWVDHGLRALKDLPDFSEAAYDGASRRIVLYSDPVMTLDPGTGALSDAGPLGREWVEAKLVYDVGSDRIVLFNELGETWALDVDTATWSRMEPVVSPPGRSFHEMAYDGSVDRVIMFGGFGPGETLLDDTWAYDVDTDAWTELTQDEAPEPRAYFAMAYDPVSERTILFGGASGTFLAEDTYDDTWALDATTGRWAELEPSSAPSARGWHAMAYEPDEQVIVLFGGGPLRQAYTAETWLFDPAAEEWSQVP